MWTGGWYRGIVPAAVMIGMTAQPGEKQNRQGSRSHAPARIEGKIGHLSDDRFFCVFLSPCGGWVASRQLRRPCRIYGLLSPCGGWVASGQKHTRVQIMVVAVPVWGWVASRQWCGWSRYARLLSPCGGGLHRTDGVDSQWLDRCCPRVGVGCIYCYCNENRVEGVAVPVWGWVASAKLHSR